VVAVPAPDGAEGGVAFWTPNGLHRLNAVTRMGGKSLTALISPDPALAYRILALNTEKAHNTKERSLEAVRMAEGLAELDASRKESEFPLEFEEPHLVTLGCAYQERPARPHAEGRRDVRQRKDSPRSGGEDRGGIGVGSAAPIHVSRPVSRADSAETSTGRTPQSA
jgi:hypothetical protein